VDSNCIRRLRKLMQWPSIWPHTLFDAGNSRNSRRVVRPQRAAFSETAEDTLFVRNGGTSLGLPRLSQRI
jgi:hypothetical protein